MWYCAYRVSDGQFLRGATMPPDYDPATEAVQAYQEHLRPDTRRHRFDAAAPDKKRLATAQELAEYDDERADAAAAAELDGPDRKMIKAAVIWIAGRLNVPPATARAEILAIYKGLTS